MPIRYLTSTLTVGALLSLAIGVAAETPTGRSLAFGDHPAQSTHPPMAVGGYYYDTPQSCSRPYGGFYKDCTYGNGYGRSPPGHGPGGYYSPPPVYYGPSYYEGYSQGYERGYRSGQRNPPNTNRRNKFR